MCVWFKNLCLEALHTFLQTCISKVPTFDSQNIFYFADVHPPKFISCPSNIDVFTTEAVTWDMPKHVDNVGINSLDFLGSHRNNTRFPVGSFLLGYIARDYEGNVAVCQFKVSVWEEGIVL